MRPFNSTHSSADGLSSAVVKVIQEWGKRVSRHRFNFNTT
jgi:hypothetical protein